MTTEQINEIYCHAPTLILPVTLPLLGLPIEVWVKLGSTLGYAGLEWRPIRSVAEVQIQSGILTDAAKSNIKSTEQSYRGERTWQEASMHSNKRLAQVSYLLFPHRQDSLLDLARLQALAGDIPTTIYPTNDPEEQELQRPLKNKIMQLAPGCLEVWGLKSLESLIQYLVDHKIGINLDILHYRRLVKDLNIPADNEVIRSVLPFIKEVQFPVGRIDFNDPNRLTVQGLRSFTA